MTIVPELIGTANLKNRSRKHLAKSPKLVIESLLFLLVEGPKVARF